MDPDLAPMRILIPGHIHIDFDFILYSLVKPLSDTTENGPNPLENRIRNSGRNSR